MRRPRSHSRLPCADPCRRGLSLLEVLISLAIFLAALAALSQIGSQGMSVATEVQWESEAVLRAEGQMNSVLAGVLPMQAASGTFEDDPTWQWNLTVTAGDLHPDLMRLDMQVAHVAGNRQTYAFTLARYVRNPDVFLSTSGSSSSSSLLEGIVP